jgi:hypothetical protein
MVLASGGCFGRGVLVEWGRCESDDMEAKEVGRMVRTETRDAGRSLSASPPKAAWNSGLATSSGVNLTKEQGQSRNQ